MSNTGANTGAMPDIIVQGLCKPKDIVACDINQCCYVADSTGVWIIHDVDESKSETKQDYRIWLHNTHLISLSIANGRLLITEPKRLLIFNSNREREYTIELIGDRLAGTQHAVETSNGTIILCKYDCTYYYITEIRMTGDLIRSYGGTQDRMRLSVYRYAAYDRCHKLLFVVDQFNRRVLIFDGNLRLVQILLIDEYDFFTKVCYAKDLKLLLVFGWNPQVDVYRVLFHES